MTIAQTVVSGSEVLDHESLLLGQTQGLKSANEVNSLAVHSSRSGVCHHKLLIISSKTLEGNRRQSKTFFLTLLVLAVSKAMIISDVALENKRKSVSCLVVS